MIIRKARIGDTESIKQIIKAYAKDGIIIPRSTYEIYGHIRDFSVAFEGSGILGCCAAPVYGNELVQNKISEDVLAEIRSLAVLPEKRRRGIGTALVEEAIKDLKELGATKVFALTYETEFFRSVGFKEICLSELPQKVWADCKGCLKFPDECDEVAMVRYI